MKEMERNTAFRKVILTPRNGNVLYIRRILYIHGRLLAAYPFCMVPYRHYSEYIF